MSEPTKYDSSVPALHGRFRNAVASVIPADTLRNLNSRRRNFFKPGCAICDLSAVEPD